MDDAKDQQIFLVKQHFSAFTKNKFLLKFLIESLVILSMKKCNPLHHQFNLH